ncbi:MAG: hypothetical protein HYY23_17480 [Verrucomicrobia bacterium]|nr:hypothetical protein [Verrucomicrobiota bacterium]
MIAPLPRHSFGVLCRKLRWLLFLSAIAVLGFSTRAATEAQRRDHLGWILKNLPDAPAWRAWQQKTGALPPDFDALPSANFLPDPFKFHDGRAVNMPAATQTRAIEWMTTNLSQR